VNKHVKMIKLMFWS